MADFLFDGPNRTITEPTGTGDTTADVGRDLYSAWKRWVASGAGAQWPPAFQVEGGTPIGATGLFTGTTFILINGWKVVAADYDHQLLLIGNLYSADGVVSLPAPTAAATIFVSATVGAQGISVDNTGTFTTTDRQALELARDHARAANQQTKT